MVRSGKSFIFNARRQLVLREDGCQLHNTRFGSTRLSGRLSPGFPRVHKTSGCGTSEVPFGACRRLRAYDGLTEVIPGQRYGSEKLRRRLDCTNDFLEGGPNYSCLDCPKRGTGQVQHTFGSIQLGCRAGIALRFSAQRKSLAGTVKES
jgi:hypothetical protein